MNDDKDRIEEGVEHFDRLEISRQFEDDQLTFRIRASHIGGSSATIDFAVEAANGTQVSHLRGEVALDHVLATGRSIASLLNTVAVALGKVKPNAKVEELRREHPNAGRPWSKQDDLRLTEQFRAGQAIPDLAKEFGRTPGGIEARLIRFGLMAPFNRRFYSVA